METVEIKDIKERRSALDFEMLKINVSFDIERLKSVVTGILSENPPILKDGYKTYAGVGLQYEDESNPIFDCVEQIAYIRPNKDYTRFRSSQSTSFNKINKLGQRLSFVFDVFSGIDLFKGRILVAAPGHVHAAHIDGSRDCRIHIPITTNESCLMSYKESKYHMLADGGAYLCNTSQPHSFANRGMTDRIHIVFLI